MTDPQRRHRSRDDASPARPPAPPAPTGWALSRQARLTSAEDEWCTCGAELSSCLGCGLVRCLACDPYLSDDCRWKL